MDHITITMAKEYSERSFLLDIDDYSLVEEYFRGEGIDDFQYEKPEGKKKNNEETVDKIQEILHKQDDERQQKIENDFRHICSFSNEKGSQNLMMEAAEQKLNIPAKQAIEQNATDRAFWFFVKHPEVFEQASIVQQFYVSGWQRVPVPRKQISSIEGLLRRYMTKKRKNFGQTSVTLGLNLRNWLTQMRATISRQKPCYL